MRKFIVAIIAIVLTITGFSSAFADRDCRIVETNAIGLQTQSDDPEDISPLIENSYELEDEYTDKSALIINYDASEDIIASAVDGNIAWTLYSNYALEINGTGKMTSSSWRSLSEKIRSVVIDEGITTVSDKAFANCTKLKKVTLPSGLTEIGKFAFDNCTALTLVSIPSTVTKIGDCAFANCTNLTDVVFYGKYPKIGLSVYDANTGICNHYPSGDRSWDNAAISGGSFITYANDTPGKATGFIAVRGDTSVNLAWKAAGQEDGYTLYRASAKSGPYTAIKSISGSHTTASALPSSGTYYYKISAYTICNGTRVYGESSDVISIGTLEAPEGLTAVQAGNVINIAWIKVSGAQGYSLLRSTARDGRYTAVKSVAGTSTVNGAPVTGTYFFKVKPYITVDGQRLYGQCTGPVGITILNAPDEIIEVRNGNVYTIAWTKVEGAIGYTLMRSTSKNGTYMAIKSVKTAVTTNTMPDSAVYYYKVKPYVLSGTQKVYGQLSTAARVVRLTQPAWESAGSADAGKASLTWRETAGADGYTIYRASVKDGTYTAIRSTQETSAICANMTSGSQYYFKIRPYVLMNGQKVYGAYSAVRSIKIK